MCLLCDSSRPTTAHILNGCPVVLNQQRCTYHHNQMPSALATMLTNAFADCPSIQVFADLNNRRACEAPQATIPTSILITPCCLDIVLYKLQVHSVAMLELTCPLDSVHHLESAWNRKQSKVEYLQLLAEFDRLSISSYYETIEISALGHYQPASIGNYLNFINFSTRTIPKSTVRKYLDHN